ncbi:probable WRKY transcription factor 32 isoform X1 [Populus trichocarpa]|uniref:probable WRKY transcription factor 32 isoform X1 n=1 Tax=Populus trichocarpa TaxID=3694 RepID=UPI000CCCFBBA|nr:probable WRKY transcription factor 32 isoform X1 [Populus trichocarpa]|eukprot:XP_024446053.1 probable WRKY transcription factor 32 isoform X1 [Populus trichocarpa]
MAESESFEALAVQNKEHKREGNEQNDGDFVGEEELEGDYNEEEEEEEEEEEKESQLSELQQIVPSPQKEEQVREEQVETLTVVPRSSTEILPKENDQYSDDLAGLKGNSAAETHVEAEYKEQVGLSHQEVLGSVADKNSGAQTQNQLQPSVCPTSLSELSPTSVTQPISSAPSPTPPVKKLSPPEVKNACISEAGNQSSAELKALYVPVAKTSIPDGYNWRKYGQKQVKSPRGSRSYYKCTYFDCCAKKIECSDHSGHVIEIVNKGMHSHDPPRKNKSTRKSRTGLSVGPILQTTVTEHTVRMLKDSEPATLSIELVQETSAISERKRQSSSSSDENKETQIKEENTSEPEPKRRLKGNLECSKAVLKPGKKPKFVVHAAGDVGISGDGYRWRKYGQKMVKGNPHPRNYYRCTSAGCPVRKHIETAVDNTNALIITYKGVHDHDMPVPKKRHGPPSAPLVAAAAPASMSNLPIKKADALQGQVTSTQWSVGKEGELNGETLDLGGEKEKAIESARTLLSIGFEIKPC